MTTKALVILSGGQDSTTCLFQALKEYDEVFTITYDYGQKHACELRAAEQVAYMAGLDQFHRRQMKVGNILVGSSPLVSDNELEQYADHNSLPGGLEKTFVPGRNMLFLTLAANLAYSLGITNVITGVCEEDYGGYPDCRLDFIGRIEKTIRTGFAYDEHDPFAHFKIHTPLMHLTKAETVNMAYDLGPACWNALAYTHTAYDGKYPPIGKDHATLLREKGFLEANKPDPLVVRAWTEGLMELPGTSNYNMFRQPLEEQRIDLEG